MAPTRVVRSPTGPLPAHARLPACASACRPRTEFGRCRTPSCGSCDRRSAADRRRPRRRDRTGGGPPGTATQAPETAAVWPGWGCLTLAVFTSHNAYYVNYNDSRATRCGRASLEARGPVLLLVSGVLISARRTPWSSRHVPRVQPCTAHACHPACPCLANPSAFQARRAPWRRVFAPAGV